MNALSLIHEITATYQKHGWTVRRILLRPETRTEIEVRLTELPESAQLVEAEFDGMWFSRPSHEGREAWELRLVAEHRFALFEAFEKDEAEEDREDLRREMENRMREHAAAPKPAGELGTLTDL